MSNTLAIMFEADGEFEDAQAEKECFGGHGGDGKSTPGTHKKFDYDAG